MELEGGFNVLNFAIEQERVNIVKHLASLTADKPEQRQMLLGNKHGKDKICAVH